MEDFYKDRTCQAISHLYGLLYKITGFYKHEIYPLVVFDGKPDDLKRKITRNEAHDFKILEEWYRKALKANDRETMKSIGFDPFFMWKTIVKESKLLLISMGVPIFTALGEAEVQCAYFTSSGYCDFTLSSDFDSLLFGCPNLIKQLSFSGREIQNGKWKTAKGTASVISLDRSLRSLNINLIQLIDVSLLIGNDFFEGIKGIGAKTALDYVQRFGDLDSIMDFLNVPQKIRNEMNQARELVLFPVVTEKAPELE